jgi:hypothetical protein
VHRELKSFAGEQKGCINYGQRETPGEPLLTHSAANGSGAAAARNEGGMESKVKNRQCKH